MTEYTQICILPTGDWAEINENNNIIFAHLDKATFEALCNGDIDAKQALQIRDGEALLSQFI